MKIVKKKVGKSFSERVVEAVLTIPVGRVTTYGRIAKACGATAPKLAQSITSILVKAYLAGEKNIPFHRIVYANGTVWLDEEHREARLILYKNEGIVIDEKGKIKNFEEVLFEFR